MAQKSLLKNHWKTLQRTNTWKSQIKTDSWLIYLQV